MNNPGKKFLFPTEFTLFGHKYKVIFVDGLYEKESVYGDIDDPGRLIRLQPPGKVINPENAVFGRTGEIEITEKDVIETFYHEVIHAVLDGMGEETLSENEKFVNMMGKALLEIYLSSVNEEADKKAPEDESTS